MELCLSNQVSNVCDVGPSPASNTASIPRSKILRAAILVVLCLSLLLVSLDNTVLNIALPTLVRDLHANESDLQWIVDSYAVIYAGLLLMAGSLGDRFGRKRIFLVGLVIFGAGSAGSAFSGSVTRLVLARAIMGVGAACVMPSTLAILTNVFTGTRSQSRAIGVWSGTAGIGIAVGPILGGWLLAHFWWGSVFLINTPIALVGAVATILLIPESKSAKRRPIDFVGFVLSTVGLGALLFSIIEIPERGWSSPVVAVSGVFSLVVLAGFGIWEVNSKHPMLVLRPFRDRRFSVAMGAAALAIFSLMGLFFVLTQYLQFALGYSAFGTGIRILPVAGVLLLASPASSYLDHWFGTKAVVAVGLILTAAGLWQLSLTTQADTFSHALLGFIVLGVGAGFILAPSTSSVMGSLPQSRVGVGSATNSTAIQTGGALGVAILGSVLSVRYQAHMGAVLSGHKVPQIARQAIMGSIGGAQMVADHVGGKLGTALADTARVGFISGMDLALKVAAVVVVVSVVAVLAGLPSRPAKFTPEIGEVEPGSRDGLRPQDGDKDSTVARVSSSPARNDPLRATSGSSH